MWWRNDSSISDPVKGQNDWNESLDSDSVPLDVIQSYDSNPSSYQHLQYDNGNLRYPEIHPAETNKSSQVSRTSRRSNQSSEYRDSALDRRVYRDRAAAKIQAAYRGYSVRKSLTCLNEKQENLPSDFNQRVKKNIRLSEGK